MLCLCRVESDMDNYETETFNSREVRDKRWNELMQVKPHVMKDSTSLAGKTLYNVRYPRLVLPSKSNTRNAVWS